MYQLSLPLYAPMILETLGGARLTTTNNGRYLGETSKAAIQGMVG